MNYGRVGLAALGAMVAYFAFGFVVFGLLPAVRDEYAKYTAVYRSKEGIQSVMPVGMAAMLVAMVVIAAIYAMAYPSGGGLGEGLRFGALIGVFAVCSFVVHNHVNLNIGW